MVADKGWTAHAGKLEPRVPPCEPGKARAGARGCLERAGAPARLQAWAAHAPGAVRAGHRRAGPDLQRLPAASIRASGAGAERAAGAADCPGSQRRHRPRGPGHHHNVGGTCHLDCARRQGLQGLPSAGQGGAEVPSLECARHRPRSPPACQHATALGHALACQRSSRARLGAHRARDRPPVCLRSFHGYRRQALDLFRQHSRAFTQGRPVCAGDVLGARPAQRDPARGEPAAGLACGGGGQKEHQHGAHAAWPSSLWADRRPKPR